MSNSVPAPNTTESTKTPTHRANTAAMVAMYEAHVADGFRADSFNGDFDALPLRSSLLYREVPAYPTSEDFQNAAVSVNDDAASHWRLEAIRYRIHSPGKPLDAAALRAIAVRCAKRFYDLAEASR